MSSFNVNYTAGGTLDTVKKVLSISNIDNVDTLKIVDKIINLETVETINLINKLKSIDEIEKIKLIDEVSSIKTIEEIKKVEEVKMVQEVGHIKGFPTLYKPFNQMITKSIPALKDEYIIEYITPDFPVEIMAITVTCTGYGEQDNYDLYCDNDLWFKDWYCSEVKEGLFLGTSNIVYYSPPNTKFKIIFKNASATSKTVFFGFRMLK